VINPLRSEAEAFQILVYVVAAIALIVVVVLLIRAIT
jgi:predicted nucleic acid-binding Zn ribbon protein